MITLNEGSAIRPMEESDVAFVRNSWLKSSCYSRTNRRHAPGKLFFACHDPVVRYLLANSRVKLVICSPEQPDLIQAWAVGDVRADDAAVLHYMFVKDIFRGHGLESSLLSAVVNGRSNLVVTHQCRALEDLGELHVRCFYDPHSIITRNP